MEFHCAARSALGHDHPERPPFNRSEHAEASAIDHDDLLPDEAEAPPFFIAPAFFAACSRLRRFQI